MIRRIYTIVVIAGGFLVAACQHLPHKVTCERADGGELVCSVEP